MIEQALHKHLQSQTVLDPYMAFWAGEKAIFNQEAPPDNDDNWGYGSQYGRIVFAEDLQGDPERIMGGTLAVDIMCAEDKQNPDELEPIIRQLIHGYFFTSGAVVVAAQWKNSSFFSQPTDKVIGCTLTFELLGFPILTTYEPDVVDRINEWCAALDNIHVINHDVLPDTAWKPTGDETAVYWRLVTDNPAGWIPDTFQTIWRTATLKCHIFSRDNATAAAVARQITTRLYACKRLMKSGEAPIMVNRKNTVDMAADPLRTGQIAVEATYGVIVYVPNDQSISKIVMSDNPDERRTLNGKDQNSSTGGTESGAGAD